MRIFTFNLKRHAGFVAALLAGVLLSFQDVSAQATDPLVGTWHITVPASPPFEALHAYHVGGTMTEVSSLLPSLAETPAHGVWAPRGDGYDSNTSDWWRT
jgi:hypothetical protein